MHIGCGVDIFLDDSGLAGLERHGQRVQLVLVFPGQLEELALIAVVAWSVQ